MKQQTNNNKVTALYCRLSHEDELRGDSMSIQNQRDLLTRYAADNGYGNVKIYADDGYTGTNFNRPAFQDMLTDIEDDKIGTVIVKDLSCLGREYLQTGYYTDESQNYKNLATAAKMHNVAGLGSRGSARAFNLLMKAKYLDELTGSKGLTFASGTPITLAISKPVLTTEGGTESAAASVSGYPTSDVPADLAAAPTAITYQTENAGTWSDATSTAPTTAGKHRALFTQGEQTASVEYTIASAAKKPVVKATVLENGSVRLKWGKVKGATSYRIYKINGTSKKLIAETSNLSARIGTRGSGEYKYAVSAYISGKWTVIKPADVVTVTGD